MHSSRARSSSESLPKYRASPRTAPESCGGRGEFDEGAPRTSYVTWPLGVYFQAEVSRSTVTSYHRTRLRVAFRGSDMTAGDWLLGSLLILGFCLWLLAAAKRNSVLRLCGVALRPLARIFRRVESRPVNCTALIERNQDIIAKYLNAVTTFFSDSAPTQAKFCIAEISRREGKGHLAPGNEHIWQWEERHNIPAEYRQLKNHILGLFERRYSELWRQREQIAQTAAQVENDLPRQIRSPQQELISRNQDLTNSSISQSGKYRSWMIMATSTGTFCQTK